jgi:hypothetical protein
LGLSSSDTGISLHLHKKEQLVDVRGRVMFIENLEKYIITLSGQNEKLVRVK